MSCAPTAPFKREEQGGGRHPTCSVILCVFLHMCMAAVSRQVSVSSVSCATPLRPPSNGSIRGHAFMGSNGPITGGALMVPLGLIRKRPMSLIPAPLIDSYVHPRSMPDSVHTLSRLQNC